MELLSDPQAWLSFLTLAALEVVLGVDNIIFLSIAVDRLPSAERRRARFVGLSFAMATRIALLFCIVWLTGLRRPLFELLGRGVAGRDLILLAGGVFLAAQSALEVRDTLKGREHVGRASGAGRFWLVILEIGLIDIVFSLDSVFTAIGLSRRIEVMVAAIVVSVPFMMLLSSRVSRFIERFPTIKILALVFLIAIGGSLVAEGFHVGVPQGYLYVAMAFSAVVEGINIRLRRRG